MASGKAVIATDIAENRTVISQGRNGVLVAPGDPDALAVAAIRLLGNEKERRRMGDTARLTVRDRYEIGTCVEKIVATYNVGLNPPVAEMRSEGPSSGEGLKADR
jgi:glycosyltransferase involved in cell wall biosynthesis